MKIALVTESFLPQVNGVTNSVLRILEYLSDQGHAALVIAPDSANGPDEYAGFRVKRVPSVSMKALIPVGLPQRTLEPLLEGFNPDVIHLASPIFLGSYVAKIANRMKIPTLSVYQTDIAGFARHYGLTIAHNQLKRWVARIHMQTTRTLAPSTWACADLKKNGVNNVFLWQRGVNLKKFSPQKRSHELRKKFLGTSHSKMLIGYVGRLANEKRVDNLAVLDAQKDIQLVIVGDGPAKSRFERALPNAHFTGFKEGAELAQLYASFDVFVHTGKHETFCQSVQEALASGVPVIAPDTGGPVDLVSHGSTGYLIDTADSSSLLQAVNLMRSAENRGAMSTAARPSVIHRSWEAINAELIGHYSDLIEITARRFPPLDKEAELVA